MKLFIWEGKGVIETYGTGLIVAIAEDLDGAVEVVLAQNRCNEENFPADKPTKVIEIGAGHPDPAPAAWICEGTC